MLTCRFLQLDGMTLPEIRLVEEHYLRAGKWPWNKILNGYVRTHPEWQNRLLVEGACMLEHMSEYEQDSRRKQGLARLGVQQSAALQELSTIAQSGNDSGPEAFIDVDTDVDAEYEDLESDVDESEESVDSLDSS